MSGLFSPAVSLANRMSFTAKLLSVVIIFLVPYLIVLCTHVMQSTERINRIEQELVGLELVLQLKPMAIDVARHRGNMAQYLAGAVDKEAGILTIETKIDDELAKVLDLAKKAGYVSDNLSTLAGEWQSLKLANNKTAIMPKNFQAHSDLVSHIQSSISVITFDFSLVIQDTATEHYLQNIISFGMPQLVEELGKLRGTGAVALTDKAVTPNERISLGAVMSAAQKFNETVNQDLELLLKDPQANSSLKNASVNAHNTLKTFFDMTNNQVLLADDISLSNTTYFETGTKAIEAITAFDAQTSDLFSKNIKALHDQEVRRDWIQIGIAIIATLVGVYLATGILTSLNTNASTLRDASQKLRDGDFSTSVVVSSEDTLGTAAKSLTEMVASVAGLLNTIQDSAHEVNELSVKLQQVTDSSRQELDEQNKQTQQSASASTEMAATVREVARSCVNVTSSTEVARTAAVEGQQKVNEAIEKINVLGTDVEQAKNIISELQTDVTDIGAVLEVIRSIAEQTNLLALNAAIEAARAGEQGRGFAVVADEVRSLAKRTQDSTAEIRNVIEKLQARAEKAVGIIHQSFVGAQESVASAASAGQSLQKIVLGVESLRDLNTQIATAAEQQAAVAEQMSRNTQHLSDSAENIMNQVEKTVGYSSSLRKSAMALLENTMRFRT